MAGANLNDVTGAIASLLAANVKRLLGTAVTVSTIPPEKAEEGGDTRLNLYLYHVANDGDGGNDIPIAASGTYPIATRPLALKLFYVLTAHGVLDQAEDSATQQGLMGWAMKTLHDFPVIDENLVLDGTKIFPMLGKRTIEIILRPITPEEAVSFWSTDQVRTARLAAYYEVRTLLLPPEAPTSLSGPVTNLAMNVRPAGPPAIVATATIARYKLPTALGGQSMAVRRTPGVVALKAGAADPDTQLTATGAGLGDGTDGTIVLRGETLLSFALPGNAAVLRAADNAGWAIVIAESAVALSLQTTANVRTTSGTTPITLVPGLYSLAVRRALVAKTEGGLERTVESESNRAQFAVAPFLASATVNAGKHIVIKVDPSFDVADAAAEPQLSIAGDVYRKVTGFSGTAAKDAGSFIAHNGDTYEAAPLFDPTLPAKTYAIRLSVNGVDAQPFWLEVA